MGYDRARDLDRFRVDLKHHDGLWLRARRPGFSGERAMRKAWPALMDPESGLDSKADALTLAASAFAKSLIAWSLEMDGARVPCTLRALLDLDTEFLLELVTVWMREVALRPAAVADPEAADDTDDDDPDDEPADPDAMELDEEWLAQLPAFAKTESDEVVMADA